MDDSPEDKIKDNPSFTKMQQEMTGLVAIAKVVKLLDRIGIRHEKISEAMQQVPNIAQKYEEMVTVPDKFNEHFSGLGWVAYEGMHFELMKQAVTLAEDGKVEIAEQMLVEHYDEKTIRQKIISMRFIPEFRPRERLLLKALEDFVAERYHACVPVVLANIDGLVSDIEQKGFFSEGANLTAWDSIAAHSSGLLKLAQLFGKTRRKTSTEIITIPYRHGILHGHDLGYDNKVVAVKSWAALFALRDWVIALRKLKEEPKSQPTFRELMRQISETQEEKKRLETWKRRNLIVGSDVPVTGSSTEYKTSSPERALVEFMELWANKNYGKMAQLLSSVNQLETMGKTAGRVREIFGEATLSSFSLLNIEDFAPAVTIIETQVDYSLPDSFNMSSPQDERQP